MQSLFIIRLMAAEVIAPSCPDAAAVVAATTELVPPELAPLASSVEVSDGGETFEVKVGESHRVFADAQRNCTERVRVAAVFAAMNLAPPPPEEDTSQPRPAPKPDAPPAAAPTPPRHTWSVDVLAQARRGFASSAAGPFWLRGGGVRAAWGRAAWQGTMMAGGFMGAGDAAASSSVQMRRWYVSAGLRNTTRFAAFSLESEMSLRGNVMQVQAREVRKPASGSRIEGSLHASLALRWRSAGHLTPVVGVEVEGVPRPTELRLLPLGRVGQSPAVWAGLFLGLGWHGP